MISFSLCLERGWLAWSGRGGLKLAYLWLFSPDENIGPAFLHPNEEPIHASARDRKMLVISVWWFCPFSGVWGVCVCVCVTIYKKEAGLVRWFTYALLQHKLWDTNFSQSVAWFSWNSSKCFDLVTKKNARLGTKKKKRTIRR